MPMVDFVPDRIDSVHHDRTAPGGEADEPPG